MSQARFPRLGCTMVLVVSLVACSRAGESTTTSPVTTTSVVTTTTGAPTETTPVSDAPYARGYTSLVWAGPNMGVMVCCGFAGAGIEGAENPQNDNRLFRPETGWTPIPAPAYADVGDAMAYDSQSDRVIVYALVETWAYNPVGQAWENLKPAAMPEGLAGARMAYDVDSDRVILFGGNRGAAVDETWSYDYETNTWLEMEPSARPPARDWAAFAYDAIEDQFVMFGGSSNTGDVDTWSYDYDIDTWTELRPLTGPPGRIYAQMAYDSTSKKSILFGGVAGTGEDPLADTWAFDSQTEVWTEIATSTSPSPRGWHGLAADPDTGLLVLFGGGPTRDAYTAETWTFDPQSSMWSLSP